MNRSLLALVAAFVANTPLLTAQTTTAIGADRDTTLYESTTGDLANGAGSALFVGMTGQPNARRALLRFDVAGSLPTGARILSARLLLTIETASSPATQTFDAHRVSQDWLEGATVATGSQGGGGAALAGDTTWLHTDYPNTLWSNAGGDFDPVPSFSFELPDSGQASTGSQVGIATDLQFWLDNPSMNFGWLLKGDETLASSARKLTSRQSVNSSDRPRIVLSYMVPGEVTEWGGGCTVGAGTLRLAPTGTPSGGATVALDYTGGPAQSLGATFFSLNLNAIGTELFPNCFAYLALNQLIVGGDAFTTDAAGSANESVQIPAGFPGVLLVCQGAVLDATPLGVSLSSAALIVTQ